LRQIGRRETGTVPNRRTGTARAPAAHTPLALAEQGLAPDEDRGLADRALAGLKETTAMAALPKCLLIVTAEVDPAVEAEWSKWYGEVHLLDALACWGGARPAPLLHGGGRF
jgi:hypothetical protein